MPVLTLLALLVSLLGFPLAARAADSSRITFRVSPVIIEDEAAPGESISTSLNLENLSDQLVPLSSSVSPITSKDEAGDIQIVAGSKPGEVKDWFMYESEMILDPKKERVLPIRINVPKDATPGGHYAAIFFSPFLPGQDKEGNVSVRSQVGVLFFVTVKGDIRQEGRIDQLKAPLVALQEPVDFRVRYSNTGTVHLRPSTSLAVYNLFGRQVDVVDTSRQGSLTTFPGTRRVQSYRWDGSVLPGVYRVEVKAVSGSLASASNRWFLVLPYPFLVLLIPLLVWPLGLWLRRSMPQLRKRIRRLAGQRR